MTATVTAPEDVEALGGKALDWLLATAKTTETGLTWSGVPSDDEPNPVLHSGAAGIIPALLEGRHHFGEDRYADAALCAACSLATAVEAWQDSSLYFGLTGMAFALHAVHRDLGDAASGAAAARARDLVRSRFDGTRWAEMFELMFGNAGIALGVLAVGDLDLALLAVTPYLHTADATAGGVNWKVRPSEPRSHHMAHGTLGIVYALAAVGRAADRTDLLDLAVLGAADVVAREEQGPDGFLVPHSDPPHRPDLIERYSYGWCNGPAGDALAFLLLADVLGDPAWLALADRCWNTLTRSGLPERRRPGFWDNNARCCGTAGVLALAADRLADHADDADPSTPQDQPARLARPDQPDQADQPDQPDFTEVLVADLVARATYDADGAYWSNVEHRATPSDLEPRSGWAHGNAGIARELLRYARIRTGRDTAYAVAMPDHLPVLAPTRTAA